MSSHYDFTSLDANQATLRKACNPRRSQCSDALSPGAERYYRVVGVPRCAAAWSMIPKNGHRFSEKDHAPTTG
jgi:hypothetical protein